jgi:hypothetical protein
MPHVTLTDLNWLGQVPQPRFRWDIPPSWDESPVTVPPVKKCPIWGNPTLRGGCPSSHTHRGPLKTPGAYPRNWRGGPPCPSTSTKPSPDVAFPIASISQGASHSLRRRDEPPHLGLPNAEGRRPGSEQRIFCSGRPLSPHIPTSGIPQEMLPTRAHYPQPQPLELGMDLALHSREMKAHLHDYHSRMRICPDLSAAGEPCAVYAQPRLGM